MDQTVCNYKNTTLFGYHLKELNQGEWVNDVLIGFYYEYLEEKFPEVAKSAVLLHPSTVHTAKFFTGEDLVEVLEPLELGKAAYVFIPVNNHKGHESVGGSHWSLLIWSQSAFTFYALDSLGNCNDRAAAQLAKMFYPFCSNNSPDKLNLNTVEVPRQPNSCDCGVYVLSFTEAVLSALSRGAIEVPKVDYSHVTNKYIQDFRAAMKKLILQIGPEGS